MVLEPARPSIAPISNPLSPTPALPKQAWSGRGAILLLLLILAFVGGVVFYLTPQRSAGQKRDAAPVDNGSRAEPQTTVPAPSPAPPVRTPPRYTAPPPRPRPVEFQAKHKHSFGTRCEGIVSFAPNEFDYKSAQHAVRLSRADVIRSDGPGLKDRNGRDWHFEFAGRSEKEVQTIFEDWFNQRSR